MLIIIQGPFTKNTEYLVENISNCLPNYKIIVSCYEEIKNNLIKNLKNVEFIKNSDPGTVLIPPRSKPMNLKRQAETIISGCINSNEKFVMKIRSDLSIINKKRFVESIRKIEDYFLLENTPRLITLNNGSLDVFSYYDMIFHFNDWFFVCNRERLLENCFKIKEINEKELIDPFRNKYPRNYYHHKKYRMIFHNEQLIHFAKFLLKSNSIRYCCDKRRFARLRHLIWVAKFLRLFDLKDLGLKSTKVGYPSFRTNLVAISYKSLELHQYIYRSKGNLRNFLFITLLIHGQIRKITFLFLKYLSTIKNYNINFIRNVVYKILN